MNDLKYNFLPLQFFFWSHIIVSTFRIGLELSVLPVAAISDFHCRSASFREREATKEIFCMKTTKKFLFFKTFITKLYRIEMNE